MTVRTQPTPLDRPAGDPASVRASARTLMDSSTAVDGARGQVTTTVDHVRAAWLGAAGEQFGALGDRANAALAKFPVANSEVSKALHAYADCLEQAQQEVDRAQRELERATTEHDRVVNAAQDTITTNQALLRLAAHDPDMRAVATEAEAAITRAQHQITTADTALHKAERHAQTVAQHAKTETDRAGRQAEEEIHRHADSVDREAESEFGSIYEQAATAATVVVAGLTAKEANALASTLHTLKAGDPDAIASVAKREFREAQKVAEEFGDRSPEALRAWLRYQEKLTPTQLKKLQNAIDGMDAPGEWAGNAEKFFGVLGKAGLTVGAIADIATVFSHDSSTLDKALSGGNALGTLAASLGTRTGAELLVRLGASEALAAAIPGVGEGVMLVTALYLGGEYVSKHWDQLKSLAGDLAHDVETGAVDLNDAAKTYVPGVSIGEHGIDDALHPLRTGKAVLGVVTHPGDDLDAVGSAVTHPGRTLSGIAHAIVPGL